ncbi:MAG TPA: helix-turn-helix domain-containing protein [Tepidisphaeraceae bacterium]
MGSIDREAETVLRRPAASSAQQYTPSTYGDKANPLSAVGMVDEDAAAKFLGLQKQTLAKWRLVGKGPSFCRFGRSIRYRPRDLEAFVESHMVNHGEAE